MGNGQQILACTLDLSWGVVAALCLLELVVWLRRARRLDVAASLALFAGALALRFALATWGPGDFQAKQRWAFASSQEGLHSSFLGNAPTVLAQWLFMVFPESDTTLVVVSLLLGSAAPVLLARFLSTASGDRLLGYASGFLLAAQPILVRFSGDTSRQAQVVFLALLGLWSLARYERQRTLRYLVLFVAACWLCYRTRPEAMLILPVAGLFVLAVHLRPLERLRSTWFRLELGALAFAALLFGGCFAHLHVAQPAVSEHSSMVFGWRNFLTPESSLWLDPDYTSVFVTALFAVGVALFWRSPRLTSWALVSLMAGAYAASMMPSGLLCIASARYQSLPVVWFCIVAGHGLAQTHALLASRLPPWLKWIPGGAAVALVLATSIAPMRSVTAPRTVDYEYAFIRGALGQLPEDARIHYTVGTHASTTGGLRTPDFLSPMLGFPRQQWVRWPPDAEARSSVDLYYHSSECSVHEEHLLGYGPEAEQILSGCREAIAACRGRPLVVADIPAQPLCIESFAADPIRIGFYEVPSASPPRPAK